MEKQLVVARQMENGKWRAVCKSMTVMWADGDTAQAAIDQFKLEYEPMKSFVTGLDFEYSIGV